MQQVLLTHQLGTVAQHHVAVFKHLQHILFGRLRNQGQTILERVFKRTKTVVWWNFLLTFSKTNQTQKIILFYNSLGVLRPGFSDPHPLPVMELAGLLWELGGFHLYLRVVLLIILLGESVAVIQQEATAEQLYLLPQLEVLWGVILIHFLC